MKLKGNAQRKASFGLLTGADERRLAALRAKAAERPITTLLNFRLVAVEGVESKEKLAFIEDLSLGDVAFLRAEFDRADCGVETEIEVECQECFGTTRIELPFDRGFFLPEKPTAKRSSSSPP